MNNVDTEIRRTCFFEGRPVFVKQAQFELGTTAYPPLQGSIPGASIYDGNATFPAVEASHEDVVPQSSRSNSQLVTSATEARS